MSVVQVGLKDVSYERDNGAAKAAACAALTHAEHPESKAT